VITALLLTTLAITIVASLFWQQQVQVRSIENQRLQLQKQWILRGALDWAALILRGGRQAFERRQSGRTLGGAARGNPARSICRKRPREDDVSDAALSAASAMRQARYNLTNLCPSGAINPAEVAVFARLLGNADWIPRWLRQPPT